jgi:urate oxidase
MSSASGLISQRYGKARVRVMRVVRKDGGIHAVHEVTASVMLQGDFSDAYLSDDNHQVVATDTMKNTVHVLAHGNLGNVLEDFAFLLGDHFLSQFAHVSRVEIELVATPWERYVAADGAAHPHAFVGAGPGRPFTRVAMSRTETAIASGVRGVLLLKSTASAFKGFPRDDYTSLPETDDRILSTSMDASWTYTRRDANFSSGNAMALSALLETFATEFSPSVQNTLYLMGRAALDAVPAIDTVSLAMPNKHYLPLNLQPFGRPNDHEIFLPTDEPHGQIEATIGRPAA